ncbi:MAG: hypothetical protein ACTTI6_08210 [Treponema sp.]|uniref:hypothetical protein n=1 Tax=Treponema sp. TaxID=166 RepID=UPI003FA28FA3
MDILETIRTHRLIFLAATLGLLIILLIISVALLINGTKKIETDPDEIMISIDPVVFQLPNEPLELPPIQYSRKQKKIWSDADLQYWYTMPDAEQMKRLHEINEQQMNKLWESVP